VFSDFIFTHKSHRTFAKIVLLKVKKYSVASQLSNNCLSSVTDRPLVWQSRE